MMDWPTIAYFSAVVVAYLFGRATKSFQSYKDGVDYGMGVGVANTLKEIDDIMCKRGIEKEFRKIMEEESKEGRQ